jgi:transposase
LTFLGLSLIIPDRSVETSTAWLRKHPEIDLVSRDRGQIFREAATQGAPQAKQVVDRYHLQKNFAEALEKFFRKQERVLKKATEGSTGKARPAERAAVPEKVSHERRARHRQRVRLHKRIWKLYREGYHKEQIAEARGSQFAQRLSCPRTRNASTSATTISLFFHR